MITGRGKGRRQGEIWKVGKFYVATPQTVENDLKKFPHLLDGFSLVIFDEMLRSSEGK